MTINLKNLDEKQFKRFKQDLVVEEDLHVKSSLNSYLNLEEAPSIQPTPELFSDPVKLWESLNSIGAQYGGVKLIPPSGWIPPFCLNFDSLELHLRLQKIHKLSKGASFQFPQKKWTVTKFRKYGDKFKKKFQKNMKINKKESNNLSCHYLKDYITSCEYEYWNLVDNPNSPISVYYAADLEVTKIGSGFPSDIDGHDKHSVNSDVDGSNNNTVQTPNTCIPNGSSHDYSYYAKHSWNLLNLARASGSLLKTFPRIIPGVTHPWLYLGMLFSSFCWHTEDNYFGAVNYQHMGDTKVWYIIPPAQATAMQSLMKKVSKSSKNDIIYSLTLQISPRIIQENNINVFTIRQSANEFVLLWPRTYHCGFNTGFNCNEACNIAPPVWLDWGRLAIETYRFSRNVCIPYEQLIYNVVVNENLDCNLLSKLIPCLEELILKDYSFRKKIPVLQLPIIVPNELLKIISAEGLSILPDHYKIPIGSNILSPKDCFNVKLLQSLFSIDIVSKKDYFEILKYLFLPCLDCSNCKAACYLGNASIVTRYYYISAFIGCVHQNEFVCVECYLDYPDLIKCNGKICNRKMCIYRFSLASQIQILNIFKSQDYQHNDVDHSTISSFNMISVEQAKLFEKNKALNMLLCTANPKIVDSKRFKLFFKRKIRLLDEQITTDLIWNLIKEWILQLESFQDIQHDINEYIVDDLIHLSSKFLIQAWKEEEYNSDDTDED